MTNPTIQMPHPADAFAEMDAAVTRRRYMAAAAVVAVLAVLGAVVGFALSGGGADSQLVDTDDTTSTDGSADGGDPGTLEVGTSDGDDTDDDDGPAAGDDETDADDEDGPDAGDVDDEDSAAGTDDGTDDTADGGDSSSGGAAVPPAPAPDPTPAPTPDPTPVPPVVAPAELVVAPTVPLGALTTGSFDITNAGEADLTIGFGVVDPELEITGDTATALPGGATRSFDVSVDTSGFGPGPWSIGFDVLTNGGDANVDVTGTKFVLVPLGPVLTGPEVLDFGNSGQATLTVENIGTETVQVPVLFPLPGNPVTVLGAPASIAPGETYDFTVKVDRSDFEFGEWTRSLTIPNNGENLQVDLVGVKEFIIIPIDLDVEPAAFVQAPVESGTAVIPIGNAEGGPVEVDVTYGPGTWGPATQLVPAGGGVLVVHFPAQDLPPGVIQMRTVTIEWFGGSQQVMITTIGT